MALTDLTDEQIVEANIRAAVRNLTGHLNEAHTHVLRAYTSAVELESWHGNYEGQVGADLRHYLDDTLRSLRAVQSIHQHFKD